MNQQELDQIVEEVKNEFFPDGNFSDSYYGQFLRSSDPSRLDAYFLYTSVQKHALLEAYIEINAWEKSTESSTISTDGSTDFSTIIDQSRSLGTTLAPMILRYLKLGFRKGKSTAAAPSEKKAADAAWDELLAEDPYIEELLLDANFPLLEQMELLVAMQMLQAAHYLLHKDPERSPLISICGGFCFGLTATAAMGWVFGSRVAEMVLLAEDLNLEGEPDG